MIKLDLRQASLSLRSPGSTVCRPHNAMQRLSGGVAMPGTRSTTGCCVPVTQRWLKLAVVAYDKFQENCIRLMGSPCTDKCCDRWLY